MTRALVMMLILALGVPAGHTQEADAPASPAIRHILITVDDRDSGSEPGALAGGLMGAALELGEGYQVTGDEDLAAWRIEVKLDGKGPWRLRVRAIPMNEMGERITMKDTFGNRAELADAIDRALVELHAVWNEGSGTPPALASFLSGSDEAVDSYLEGLAAFRSGRFAQAEALWSRALSADPTFHLVLAELSALRSTARAGSAVGSSGEGDVSLPEEFLSTTTPPIVLGDLLRGLALVREDEYVEAARPLGRAGAARPDDPRAQYWNGVALMAEGDFEAAAAAFARAREKWPELLRAYTLEAESRVRMRDTEAARSVLEAMAGFMTERAIVPERSALHPGLMLGSMDLLEGRFSDALERYEEEALKMQATGVYGEALHQLRTTIVEMRRDLVRDDGSSRERRIEIAWEALQEYKEAVPEEVRADRPWEALRLEGLNHLKEGNTIEAWRLIEEIKSFAGMPGYDDYYEAYLTAATMLKEGDMKGCAEQFKRAAEARSHLSDLMDVVMTQKQLKNLDEAKRRLAEFERRLSRYDPSDPDYDDLILTDGHLAALVPMYHYTWARIAFETGQPDVSRRHFGYMLSYLQEPDENLVPLVKEAYGRGAKPL